MMSSYAFWGALFFVWYAYMGYPLALRLMLLLRNRPVRKESITPQVTFIIAAFNEEKRIQDKLQNTLQLDYPKGQLQILVASDCSSDRTDAIVQGYAAQGVQLARAPERKGKEYAQMHALTVATGDIVVFSDVATILHPDAVRTIVKNFADPSVGCVSSVDKFIDPDGTISGEGAYVKYEMLLRSLESRVNTLVGLSGSFFAAKREVCAQWAPHLQSDFNTVLNAVRFGLRGVSDPDSIGYYRNIADERREYERKVRTVLRGISVFMHSVPLINPLRYGLFAWQLISHKLCRWLVPFALIAMLASNAVLALELQGYLLLFGVQMLFYVVAGVGILMKGKCDLGLAKVPSFFVMVNLSILTAWYRYVSGDRIVSWKPSER